MNRRGFLRLAALAALGAAVDPEQLLWTPGQKTHFLPPTQGWQPDQWQPDQYFMLTQRISLAEYKRQYAVVDNGVEYWYKRFAPDPSKSPYREAVADAAHRLADHIDRTAIDAFFPQFRIVPTGTVANPAMAEVVGKLIDQIAQEHAEEINRAALEAMLRRPSFGPIVPTK